MKRFISLICAVFLCMSLCGCKITVLKDSIRLSATEEDVLELKDIEGLSFFSETSDNMLHWWIGDDPELISEFAKAVGEIKFSEETYTYITNYQSKMTVTVWVPDEYYEDQRVGHRLVFYSVGDEVWFAAYALSKTYVLSDSMSEEWWLDFLSRCEDLGGQERPPFPETIDVWTEDGWVTEPFGKTDD